MQIRIIPGMVVMFVLCSGSGLYAQEPDSIKLEELDAIAVTASFTHKEILSSPLVVDVADKAFIREYFTGNLVQTLEHIPGLRSMDIGSGFSKPVIRGMGFNRIAVLENGIKQEGQQWGADHGLEIDAFNAERVVIRKGPSSLMYGSDAMGGTIEIMQLPAPVDDGFFGEVVLFGKSVNGTVAGSLMLGLKKKQWYTKVRYSEQRFGDYRIPTDTVVYLTQKLPIHNKKLKNTAGFERDASLYAEYRNNGYYMSYFVSNAYQKTGFFPGAHGIPDASRLEPDGSSRNIELPYSTVNHFKATTRQQYSWETITASLDLGFQNNRRNEMSEFHTHYGKQTRPEKDPDKELFFSLNTFSASAKVRYFGSETLEYTAGSDFQYQHNDIGGYSFLLPEFERTTAGVFWITTWRVTDRFTATGGIRYDHGRQEISPFRDAYLVDYLKQNGYGEEAISAYEWRSYEVRRNFGDISGALGFVWNIERGHLLKINIGRSFRLPGANELAANGVHHGTFRHEQGDPSLKSERGWQLDVGYSYEREWLSASLSPFVSRYNNYIYLKPTGEWSVLPHAGQIYRYTGAEAIFAGAEFVLGVELPYGFSYSFSGEYIYNRNLDEKIPLAFSSPALMRNTLSWSAKDIKVHLELESIARQTRVARNESPTAGANLVHAGASLNIPVKQNQVELTFLCRNLLDKKYYNHLSFYRHVEIPEPGRNFQLLIKVPFKTK
ncbi:MAG: TonB-dependent receptor [Rikenellaceae bacterium]|nr:TonB-dependent receptor [Rikenellaceae bacterium]